MCDFFGTEEVGGFLKSRALDPEGRRRPLTTSGDEGDGGKEVNGGAENSAPGCGDEGSPIAVPGRLSARPLRNLNHILGFRPGTFDLSCSTSVLLTGGGCTNIGGISGSGLGNT